MAAGTAGAAEAETRPKFDSIVIAPGRIKYMNPNFHRLQAKMYDYKCDVKLTVAGSKFKAHRDVLGEASDYFSAMFSHDMLEREQDVIELRGISPAGFSIILDYFYHGHITMDPDNIEDVLEAARFFHVEFLIEACCDYLVYHLGMDNYQSVLILADKYWLGDLRSDIFSFFGSNIVKLSEEKQFFENLDGDLLVQFLKEDVFVDAPENFLLFLVRRWVATVPEERSQLLLPLLRLIRFPLVDLETLETCPVNLTQFPEIEDAVEEARRYNLDVAGQCLHHEPHFTARGARPNLLMLAFPEGRFVLNYRLLAEEPYSCTEEIQGDVGVDLTYSRMIAVGDFLFAVGGYDQQVCSSRQVFRFSARTREWVELASMNQARVSHAVCASHDRIVAVGGVDHQVGEHGESEINLSSVEMYDVASNTWLPLPPLVHASYDHATSFYNGVMFVSGGISNDPQETIPTGSSYLLSLSSQAWEPMASMIYPRHSHSMTAVSGRLYVIGGYMMNPDPRAGGFADCPFNEVYDLETSQWTALACTPPTFGHLLRSVGLHDNDIFVVGNGQLGCYHTDQDSFQCLEYYGQFVHTLAVMRVAYPVC